MPIVLHKDKVMQAIVRSEENLESTPEYNKEKEGRALEYQRAPDLVKYEVPMNLLFTPEEVEKAFGMGSSDVEGLVAMRQIKERLFLGENLDDYIVAVAENPF
jgi:hypothetical protein